MQRNDCETKAKREYTRKTVTRAESPMQERRRNDAGPRDRDSSSETLVHASWMLDLLLINVIPNL